MNVILAVLATLAAYLIGAGWYGRRFLARERKATRLYGGGPSRVPKYDADDRTALAMLAAFIGAFWPFHIAYVALIRWLWKPTDLDEERAERLKVDLQDWRQRERDATTDDERRMAHDIAATLADLLNQRAGSRE